MRSKSLIASLAVLLLLLFMPVFQASAQWCNPGPGKGMGMGHGRGMDMDQHMKNLENLRMLKLLELLELNDEQNDKFIARFAKLRSDMRKIAQQIENKTDTLADLIKSDNFSDREIMARIDELDNIRLQMGNLFKDFHKDAANILTAVQMGKMVVFESRFERELIQSVRGFRERMAPDSDPESQP